MRLNLSGKSILGVVGGQYNQFGHCAYPGGFINLASSIRRRKVKLLLARVNEKGRWPDAVCRAWRNRNNRDP